MNIECISQYHEFPGNHYEYGTMPTQNQERLTFNNYRKQYGTNLSF